MMLVVSVWWWLVQYKFLEFVFGAGQSVCGKSQSQFFVSSGMILA